MVRGALGSMGAGNTSVLMQLLVGMLDAALARQQDTVPAQRRVAVALKVDEAPLVLNRGFAETLALKRSAGLETVACWQTDAQWTDREVREQLDALFAHRVYFATASVRDARASASLMMAEFSDTVRPEMRGLSALGHPDARLHLPKHHAIASWVAPRGRQAPFVAQTIPLRVDHERLRLHAERQAERGGRYLADLSQPHWERAERQSGSDAPRGSDAARTRGSTESDAESVELGDPGRGEERGGGGRGEEGGGGRGGGRVGPPRGERRERARSRSSAPTRPLAAPRDRRGELRRAGRPRRRAPPALGPGRRPRPAPLEPDPLDLEILALVAGVRHVLTQPDPSPLQPPAGAHHHPAAPQAPLRRGARGALPVPPRRWGRGADVLRDRSSRARAAGGAQRLDVAAEREVNEDASTPPPNPPPSVQRPVSRCRAPVVLARPVAGDRRLRQARHDVHVTGWALALERALGGAALKLRGREESALSPPLRSTPAGRVAIGPADLRLPGGRAPHDFLRTDPAGARVEVERFETVRPDASVDAVGRGGSQGRGCACSSSATTASPLGSHACRRRSSSATTTCSAGWSVCAPRFAPPRRGAGRSWCSSAATATARGSAHGGPTTAERVPGIRRRVPARLGVPRTRRGSCSHPSATSTRACCSPTASPACPPRCARRPRGPRRSRGRVRAADVAHAVTVRR